MKMRRQLAVAILALAASSLPVVALAAPGIAASDDVLVQWAPVVRTVPIYVRISEPVQQCRIERVTTNEYVDRNGVPIGDVASGITGGTLGGDAGSANARGAAAIDRIADRARAGIAVAPVTRDVERCERVDRGRDIIDGYDVTYVYQGRESTTRLPYDPGDRVRIRVDVAPAPR